MMMWNRTATTPALGAPLGLMQPFFEQAPVGMIWRYGPDGDLYEVNATGQKIFGAPLDPFRGYGHLIFTPDRRPLPRHELPSHRALRGERVIDTEFLIKRGGDYVPIVASAAPVIDRFDATMGAVVAFRETRAAKELECSHAEWNAVVAHDLRQPLASILFNAQALARKTPHPQVLAYAERIRCATGRLQRMVGDLLDVSRLEARRLELVRRRVDVPALVRASVECFSSETNDRPFELRVEDDVPEAWVDPERITQVLENLLTNAVKYGAPGTPIVLSVAHVGGAVVVAVTNHGRGLSAAEISELFARFRRTASARREGTPGIGLGLYISRSLVEAHGGVLTAESVEAGITTFRFTLPVV